MSFKTADLTNGGWAPLSPPAFSRFRMTNGLTVIVHEDHRAPIISLELRYRVGSGHEPAGRHGLAQLTGCLMASSSQHYRRSFSEAFGRIGASRINHGVGFDHTSFSVTIPANALDFALWLESDRMGHLPGAKDQQILDTIRAAAPAARRSAQRGSSYRVEEVMLANAFPANHPYAHAVAGSIGDLNSCLSADVKHWFKTHYGAANATLVLAGAITLEQAREKVELYFGGIMPGPAVGHPLPWEPRRETPARGEIYGAVREAKFIRQWNGPHWGHEDGSFLELGAAVLADRLERVFERETQEAKSVRIDFPHRAVCRPLSIIVRLKEDADPADVEARLDLELARFLREGPGVAELGSARARISAGLARQIEGSRALPGKAALLGEGQVLRSLPNASFGDLASMFDASCVGVKRAARRWLAEDHYSLAITPQKDAREIAPDRGIAGWPAEPRARIFSQPPARAASRLHTNISRDDGPPPVLVALPRLVPADESLAIFAPHIQALG